MAIHSEFRMLEFALIVAAMLLAAAFIVWFIRRRSRVLREDESRQDAAVAAILKLKKERIIYTALVEFAWLALAIIAVIQSDEAPGTGDLFLFMGVEYYIRTGLWQGDKTIMWLRRFNVKRRKKFRFDQILKFAGWGHGVSITVQDSSIKINSDMAFAQFIRRWPIIILLLSALLFVVKNVPEELHGIAFIVGVVGIISLIPYWYFSGKLGFLSLKKKRMRTIWCLIY